MSLKLPPEVYSRDQLGIVLWEIGVLVAQLRNDATRQKISGVTSDSSKHHVSAFLLAILRANSVDKANLNALEALESELVQIRDTAPVAHMVLPALPNRTLKQQLVTWFRDEISESTLVSFSVRGDIGGGFILRIGSKQYDFTFRRQLLDNKHRIAEIYDSVR